MPWMTALHQTFNANSHIIGKLVDGVPLAPISHMVANVQIELSIDLEGNFCGAIELKKEDGKTLIPVTENSAGRANANAPHALCDNLSYIAGDFAQYVPDLNTSKKFSERFEKYLTDLRNWMQSPYSHPKVTAVYAYISKRQMTRDLIAAGILEVVNGTLLDKKLSGVAYEKAFVRFRVIDCTPDAVWLDETLFEQFIRYYDSIYRGGMGLCYLTGEVAPLSTSSPKGIIAATYGAKLISANDTANFTFLGRFDTAEQASGVGYTATQMAHSALTWLAAHQSVVVGNQDKRTYICWNPGGKTVAALEDPFGLTDDSEPHSYTEEAYKKRLIKTLAGFRGELDNNDNIVTIGLDAATTGRLSILYYNELNGSDFYDRLIHWGQSCCWYFTQFTSDKKPFLIPKTPPTKQIVCCAFGVERNEFLDVSDKVMKEQYQRLLSCMLDRKPLPRDIMHAAVLHASMPLAHSRGNRERVLSTACALISKYHSDMAKGVSIKMTLDYGNNDRSYLFGRLLAVLEKAERHTYSKDETREPNAIRLQSAYINHPMSTWKVLEEKLNPYFQRMSPGSRIFYKNILSEITKQLTLNYSSDTLNRPLEELYLIGYYLQRMELN